MTCTSTRDDEPCIRTTEHGPQDQHRSASGRRWYYGDDMQRGMPKRHINDNTPLVMLLDMPANWNYSEAPEPYDP